MKEATKKRDFEKVVQLRGRYDIKQQLLLTPTLSQIWSMSIFSFSVLRSLLAAKWDATSSTNQFTRIPLLIAGCTQFPPPIVRALFPCLLLAARIFLTDLCDWSVWFSLCVILSIAKDNCVIVIFRTFKSSIEIFKVLRKVEPPASSECDLSGECKVCHSLLSTPTLPFLQGPLVEGFSREGIVDWAVSYARNVSAAIPVFLL